MTTYLQVTFLISAVLSFFLFVILHYAYDNAPGHETPRSFPLLLSRPTAWWRHLLGFYLFVYAIFIVFSVLVLYVMLSRFDWPLAAHVLTSEATLGMLLGTLTGLFFYVTLFGSDTRLRYLAFLPATILFLFIGFFSDDARSILTRLTAIETPAVTFSLSAPPADLPMVTHTTPAADDPSTEVLAATSDFALGAQRLNSMREWTANDLELATACFASPAAREEWTVREDGADTSRTASCPAHISQSLDATALLGMHHFHSILDKPFMQTLRCLDVYSQFFPNGLPVQEALFNISMPLLRSYETDELEEMDEGDIKRSISRIRHEMRATAGRMLQRLNATGLLGGKPDRQQRLQECNTIDDSQAELVQDWQGIPRPYRDLIVAEIVTASGYPKEGLLHLVREYFAEPYNVPEGNLNFSEVTEARILAEIAVLALHVGDYRAYLHAELERRRRYGRIVSAWRVGTQEEPRKVDFLALEKELVRCAEEAWPLHLRRYMYALVAIDSNLIYYIGKHEQEMLEDVTVEELIFSIAEGLRRYVQVPDPLDGDRTAMLTYECFSKILSKEQWDSNRAEALIGYAYLEVALAEGQFGSVGDDVEEVRARYLEKAGRALLDAARLVRCSEEKPSQIAEKSLQETVLRNTASQRQCRELRELTELVRLGD